MADTRGIGPLEIIRSDDAPELKGGRFAEICRKHHIKREFTSASTRQLNGVAERGLTLIGKVEKASSFQETLWAETHNYSCDVLNCTATTSNKDKRSAYEMWHGVKPPPTLLQWRQPCFYRTKRKLKTYAQAKPVFLPRSRTRSPSTHPPHSIPRIRTSSHHPLCYMASCSDPCPLICPTDTSCAR